MEGSKKLGAWWYGYIVPLTPREGCGLLTSPRVWNTFLGLGRVGAQGGKASKVLKGGSGPEIDDLEDPLEED